MEQTKEELKLLGPASERVENFMLLVVSVGVQKILEEKGAEILTAAQQVEEKYGSLTTAIDIEEQRGQEKKDPDYTNFIDLLVAKRRLEKELLPRGVATILIHANAIVEKYPRAIFGSVEVFCSIVDEWKKENRINQTFIDGHEKLRTKKEQRIQEIQEILDLYQERGPTDGDSQQIMTMLKNQQEFYRENIAKSAERIKLLVVDTGPLGESAGIAGQILRAGVKIAEDRDEIKKLGGVLPASPTNS